MCGQKKTSLKSRTMKQDDGFGFLICGVNTGRDEAKAGCDVQFDAGELGFVLRSVRNRDHNSRSEQPNLGHPSRGGLGKPHLFQRLFFIGTTGAIGWRVEFIFTLFEEFLCFSAVSIVLN